MIRKEVEKLRGLTFTEEEMRDVIIPILASTGYTCNKEKVSVLKKIGDLYDVINSLELSESDEKTLREAIRDYSLAMLDALENYISK